MVILCYFTWGFLFILVVHGAWVISKDNDRGNASKIGYNSLRYISNNVPRAFIAMAFLAFQIYIYYLLLNEQISDDAQIKTYVATIGAFILLLKYFKDSNKYHDAPKIETDNKKLDEANYDFITLLLSILATAIGLFLAYNS